MNKLKIEALNDYMDSTYSQLMDSRFDYNVGFGYFIMDMDREAMNVFTRLINTEENDAQTYALKLMALYIN